MQRAKPVPRKKLLALRIEEEIRVSYKERKRKANGDDSDEEHEVKLLDRKNNKGEVGDDAKEVAKEDNEQNESEQVAKEENEQNKLEEEANGQNE